MIDVRCVGRSRIPGRQPSCRQLMLRVSEDTVGYVEVKCPRCKQLNRVTVSPVEEYETRRVAHGGSFG